MNFDVLRQQIKKQTDDSLLALIESFPEHAPRLKQAMQHALLVGGKRMRPVLTHLVGNALDIPKQDQLVISMAIECIHAYSLVHDDLPAMDDDALRRGQPTCHVKFDDATAILAGDALQTLAFTILTEQPLSDRADGKRAKLVAILARASGYDGMCGGQAIDLATTGQSIDVESLTHLHQLKTGALLSACAQMMTVIADIKASDKQHFISFSRIIGLAFQVQDDILDIEGDAQLLGKPQGSDEALGKNTFPALLGMDQAKQALAKLHQEALQALASLPYNTEYLAAFTDLIVNRRH